MRRNVVFTAVAVLVLGAVAVGPVSAEQPLRGDQTMVLNQDMETGEFGLFGCPELSWFGSIDIDGTIYGMALYPLPGRITGNGMVLHYEEGWKIWTGEFSLTFDPATSWYYLDDCDPGEYVLAGTDAGVGIESPAKFTSNGVVDEALDPFAVWLDRRVHQDGILGPVDFGDLVGVLGFYGDLRLN